MIAPVSLNVEHQFFAASSGAGIAVALSGLAVISVAWTVGRARWREATLPLATALLSLVPTVVVPLHVFVNEHRIYLALALFCALGVARWSPSRRELIYAVLLLGAVMGLQSHQRNTDWKDELSLWRDAVDKAPEMFRAHMHLGGAYQIEADNHARGDDSEGRRAALVKARDSHQRAARLAPDVAEVRYNLGTTLLHLQQHGAAVHELETSLSLAPRFVPALHNLGFLYGDLGEHEKAIETLFLGLRESPERLSFHYGLGKSYDALGDRAAAVRHYTTYAASDQASPGVAQIARRRLHELAGKQGTVQTLEGGER